MVYPRRCPLCDATYGVRNHTDLNVSADTRHVTLQAEPGGTPSPWRPEDLGRLLRLRCLLCTSEYRWDYFGDRLPDGTTPAPCPRPRAKPRRPPPVTFGSRAAGSAARSSNPRTY